jgi:hypothetical protein
MSSGVEGAPLAASPAREPPERVHRALIGPRDEGNVGGRAHKNAECQHRADHQKEPRRAPLLGFILAANGSRPKPAASTSHRRWLVGLSAANRLKPECSSCTTTGAFPSNCALLRICSSAASPGLP